MPRRRTRTSKKRTVIGCIEKVGAGPSPYRIAIDRLPIDKSRCSRADDGTIMPFVLDRYEGAVVNERKPSGPRPTVAPEFAGAGRLAAVLRSSASQEARRTTTDEGASNDQSAWVVFGVGVIWQTAAENAARLTNVELGKWLTAAIEEAASEQESAKLFKR